jgi:hypothetical protein
LAPITSTIRLLWKVQRHADPIRLAGSAAALVLGGLTGFWLGRRHGATAHATATT